MFIISAALVILSSYLILSSISGEKKPPAFIYFLLIAFAQIVLSFEVLSLFKAINKNSFIICNIVFLFGGYILLSLKKNNIMQPRSPVGGINPTIFTYFKAIKRDKTLIFLSICFVLFLIFQLIKIFFFPVTFGDALSCYLQRCTNWIQNGSLMHYVTPDTRELIMPINMELLYTWVLLFRKSEMGLGFFSFVGYIGVIYILYNILKDLRFNIQKRLWAIFVFSSFAIVIIEMITPCNDLFLGMLILSSIYLFLIGVRNEDKTALYFSSLAYALAVGTKTTAIMAIPCVFIIFCAISFLYKNKQSLIFFCLLFVFNFLIFSSYNYILNFIEFNNFVSSYEQYSIHKFTDGFQGYIANLIKYFFVIFDMSGMPKFININKYIDDLLTNVLSLIGLNVQTGASDHFPWTFEYNNKIDMLCSGLGFMGLVVFIPSVIYSIKRGIQKKQSQIAVLMCCFGLSIIFNILIFSRSMVFAGYNMRYLLTFVIIAIPVLAYSYPQKHKLCKIFLCIIMFIYLIGYAHYKPVTYILECLREHKLVEIKSDDEEIDIFKYFVNKPPVKLAFITPMSKNPLFYIEKLRLYGFKTDKLLIENIENYNLTEYEYIILNKAEDFSTSIINFEDRIKHPDNYAVRCVYKDENQNEIYNIDSENRPVLVKCEIPLEYLKQQGYVEDKKCITKNYIILKRK